MSGYCNRILEVDLSAGEVKPVALRPELYELYMGGSGIGACLLLELLGEKLIDMDPLDEENPLIFMTGPFSGTTLPSTSRMTVSALSPLTGGFGEANAGGRLAAQLKFAGYDGIVVKGKAAGPVYLYADNSEARLLPAEDLWGLDTYSCTDLLQERHRQEGHMPAVAVIGPAGEKGVLYAGIVHNKGHHFGRCGLGAVMGAKNLKALVVNGSGRVQPADTEKFRAVRKRLLEKVKESMVVAALNMYGTNCSTDMGYMAGDVPIKNWRRGEWDEGIEALNGPAFDPILVDRATCYACPVACKRVVEVPEGPYRMARGPGPEYETIMAFGSMCLIPDAAAVSRFNEQCNRLGLDTISCGSTIAFALDCFEKGNLTTEMTGGLILEWGDAALVEKLITMIAAREGFGADLALGSHRLALKIGGDAPSCLSTVKRMEAPMHDPRAYHGMGLAYATSIRGACHVSGVTMPVEQGTMLIGGIGLEEYYPGQTGEGKAKMVALTQDFGMAFSTAAIVCVLGGMVYDEQDFTEALGAVTGRPWTIEEVMQTGRRIWTLKRCINLLRGMQAEEDRLPPLLLTPLEEGGAAGSVPDMEQLLAEFYRWRDFNEKGYPSRQSLEELALHSMADLLDKQQR